MAQITLSIETATGVADVKFEVVQSTGVHNLKVASVTEITNPQSAPIRAGEQSAIVNLRAIPADRLGLLKSRMTHNTITWDDLKGVPLSFNVQNNDPAFQNLPMKGETIEVLCNLVPNRDKTMDVIRPTGSFKRTNNSVQAEIAEDVLEFFGITSEAVAPKSQKEPATVAEFADQD